MVSIRSYSTLASLVGLMILSHSVSAVPMHDISVPVALAGLDGTSIENGEVAIPLQVSNGSSPVMVAMNATQRHSVPTLTNAGNSVYIVEAGGHFGDMGQRSSKGSLWSFNDHMTIDSTSTLQHSSENLMSGFLATDSPDIANVLGGTFESNAVTEYHSGIQAAQGNWGMENIATDRHVEPLNAAAWLIGSTLLGLFGVARRKKA
jgi:hypothetical protein